VRIKKAKSKGKGTARKAADKAAQKAAREVAKKEIQKESLPVVKKPVDLVKVRESIKDLVGSSAELMVGKVIEGAIAGQLASVKYLFEAVGLYPETEQTMAPQEDSVAYGLFLRLGMPAEAVPDVESEKSVLRRTLEGGEDTVE
jgi:hypothetical protein